MVRRFCALLTPICALMGCEPTPAPRAPHRQPARVKPARVKPARVQPARKPPQAPPRIARARSKPAVCTEAAARARVKSLLQMLQRGSFRRAHTLLAPKLQALLPIPQLKAAWTTYLSASGPYQEVAIQTTLVRRSLRWVVATVRFARREWSFTFTFQANGLISTFQSKPHVPPWSPPPYAKTNQVREIPLSVKHTTLSIPARLTVPAAHKRGRLPTVVLVHGSGAHDMDETILGNKVFKDLAWGLAVQGVSVLRYTKLNRAHPAALKKLLDQGVFNLDDLATNPALSAVAEARKHPFVNPRRVYVLGHSEGGFIAPRIGKRDPRLAGLISLGGNSRRLETILPEQYEYIIGLGGPNAAQVRKELQVLRRALKALADPELSRKTPAAKLPMGMPASYWLNLRSYDPVKVAARLGMPILILQGEADYQVTMKDFQAWKRGLRRKRNARFQSFPRLFHLFIDAKKKMSVPADYYMVTGHVDLSVIRAIARFVKSGR